MSQELVSIAQQFTGLPMDSLIGGPLNAAANANAAMALTQTKFMLDTCFYKGDELMDQSQDPPVSFNPQKFNYKPVMISMNITRGVVTEGDPDADPPVPTTVQQVDTTFDLPILTIIPLNSLAVQTVDINFEMEVKSSYGEKRTKEQVEKLGLDVSWELKFGKGPLSVAINGSLSYDKEDRSSFSSHYEKSNSAKYTVAVKAGQLPLPIGVTTIINAFTKEVSPILLENN